MGLPEDPAAFVAEAERAINERDPEAATGVYADQAVLERDEEVRRGEAEIGAAWRAYVADVAERGLTVRKTVTAASGDSIAGEWEGVVDGRTESKGVEYWRFDDEGRVYEHRIYGHRAAEPMESPLKRLREALVHPAAGLALLREQRRRRR
jgi:ketosteroid isomerase-like protein